MRETPRDATVPGFPGGDPDIRAAFLALGLDPHGIGPVDPVLRDPLLCLPGDWEACYAHETLKARGTDLRRFFSWCSAQGRTPLAEHATLGRAVEDYLRAAGGTLGPESFRRTASHLVAFLKGLGVPGIQADHRRRMVIRASNRAARERQTGKSEPGDRRRLSRAELKRIETAIRNRPDAPLARVRDLAIFVLMCRFLLRRDEIRNFRLIDWSPSPSGGKLIIRHSKTDQEGRGAAYMLGEQAAGRLEDWLALSGLGTIEDPELRARVPIFTAVHKGGGLRRTGGGKFAPLTGKSISRILSTNAARAGLSGVTGHTPRRSVARLMHEAGYSDEAIQEAGR